jgi:uncharacterized membrane protein YfcA
MGAEWTVLLVVAVILLATMFRSAFGFGEALVAVPLLAMLIPVEEAVPLATLVSITVAAVVVAQNWHKIHVSSGGWLVISTLFGIPLGLWLLTAVAESGVKAILAVVIIGFSLYCLVSNSQYELNVIERPKPATSERLKTSHFEEMNICCLSWLPKTPLEGGLAWQIDSKWQSLTLFTPCVNRAGRSGGSLANWG